MNNSRLLKMVIEKTRSGELQWLRGGDAWSDVWHTEFEGYGLSLRYYHGESICGWVSTSPDLCLRVENEGREIELRDRGFRFFSKPIQKLYDLLGRHRSRRALVD